MSTNIEKPTYLDQLIDLASAKAGSDYKLAKLVEVTPQTISNWRHAKKTCPVGDVVLMADIAGLKSEEWAARAIVNRYEGTSKGEKLTRALGKALAATGAGLASFGANAHQIFTSEGNGNIVSHFIRCIHSLSRKRHFAHD